MTDQQPENLGHLDDEAEEREPSSTREGAAAEGEYDPRQGSPDSGTHPVFTEMTRGTLGSEVSPDEEDAAECRGTAVERRNGRATDAEERLSTSRGSA